jgi:hypothetical protein
VIDIDGSTIHRPFFPCSIDPGGGPCTACEQAASAATAGLQRILGDAVIFAVRSGKKGYHVYIRNGTDWGAVLPRMTDMGVRIDQDAFRATDPLAGMPGTVHGSTATPIVEATPGYVDPQLSLPHFRSDVHP